MLTEEYTTREKAINLVSDFSELTNDGNLTQLGKDSAKIALQRNINNFTILAKKMYEKGHHEVYECFLVICDEEKEILKEVECL